MYWNLRLSWRGGSNDFGVDVPHPCSSLTWARFTTVATNCIIMFIFIYHTNPEDFPVLMSRETLFRQGQWKCKWSTVSWSSHNSFRRLTPAPVLLKRRYGMESGSLLRAGLKPIQYFLKSSLKMSGLRALLTPDLKTHAQTRALNNTAGYRASQLFWLPVKCFLWSRPWRVVQSSSGVRKAVLLSKFSSSCVYVGGAWVEV